MVNELFNKHGYQSIKLTFLLHIINIWFIINIYDLIGSANPLVFCGSFKTIKMFMIKYIDISDIT